MRKGNRSSSTVGTSPGKDKVVAFQGGRCSIGCWHFIFLCLSELLGWWRGGGNRSWELVPGLGWVVFWGEGSRTTDPLTHTRARPLLGFWFTDCARPPALVYKHIHILPSRPDRTLLPLFYFHLANSFSSTRSKSFIVNH